MFYQKVFSAILVLIFLVCIVSTSSIQAQVIDKVKERTLENAEDRAIEKSEEISNAIFEKLEGIFKKKKKVEEPEDQPEKKAQEEEEPRTVKKNKVSKSS